MSREEILAQVRRRWERQFEGYERMIAGVDTFLAEHEENLQTVQKRDPGFALLALAAKAYKTTRAVQLLATEGFGQDALILARSLLNLAAILAYIEEDDSEIRTRQWIAHTVKERAKVNQGLDEPEPATSPEEEALAKEWRKVTIESSPNELRESCLLTVSE